MDFEQLVFKIKDALLENQSILVILPLEYHRAAVLSIIGGISEKEVCYLTCNKSSKAIMNEFEQRRIDNKKIFFLDCVSKQAGLYDGLLPYVFLDSPIDLEELFSASSIALKKNFNYFIFDSLNSLLSHNIDKEAEVVNFAEKLANKVRGLQTKIIFLATDIQSQRDFIGEVEIFVDKVIDFSHEQNKVTA